MSNRALVLGGGGVTGIGWETGLIAGLAEQGIHLREAERIVGTSAGSSVAAAMVGKSSAEENYAVQIAEGGKEISAAIGFTNIVRLLGPQLLPLGDESIARMIGRSALNASTVPESVRRAVIAERVGADNWPRPGLLFTALDAATGERRVFDQESGVSMIDAVAASCAVPTVWPPVTIGDRRYIDGGTLSGTNTDLAAGCDVVLVLAPTTLSLRKRWSVAAQLAALGPEVQTLLLTPDAKAKQAMGKNALDPAFRAASAVAGRAQAREVGAAVGLLWH
ncbi:patatin-like phospholipase family protein [Arthrobacter sp. GMC3]|uniref:patatin-like phospholipase family protein n=1 Tax=Arthrobacter sp. GMC3 TaxID=2058894 RepID=UPI000CE2BF6B|nr:patatin-like phospholipase family protein [Arthrobacter sp. GMC3]